MTRPISLGIDAYVFLPAQRYASAGTNYGRASVCLCLCLSQVDVLSKRSNESGWSLAWKLLSADPTLWFKEIQVSSRIGILLSGTLLQALDFLAAQVADKVRGLSGRVRSGRARGVVLKKKWGRLKQDLGKDLQLHRILILQY